MGQVLHTILSVPSTQVWAREFLTSLNSPLTEPHIFWTDHQTLGHGRCNRSWQSPSGTWTVTIALPLPLNQTVSTIWPLVAAHSFIQTLEKFCPIRLQLKWPNDLYLHDQKLGGLLTEIHHPSQSLVVGLGLNVRCKQEDFDPSLQSSIAILNHDDALGLDPMDVITGWIHHLQNDLITPPPRSTLEARLWRRHEWIQWQDADFQTYTGRILGLDSWGGLQIVTGAGALKTFWFGDIQALRQPSIPQDEAKL